MTRRIGVIRSDERQFLLALLIFVAGVCIGLSLKPDTTARTDAAYLTGERRWEVAAGKPGCSVLMIRGRVADGSLTCPEPVGK